MLCQCIKITNKGLFLYLKIKANSTHNKILGVIFYSNQYWLKILIKAPATENKANQELIKFLSNILNLKKTSIIISKGESSSKKTILISTDNIKKTLQQITFIILGVLNE